MRSLEQAVWEHILKLTHFEPKGAFPKVSLGPSIDAIVFTAEQFGEAPYLLNMLLVTLNAWVAFAFDHDFPDRFTYVLICLIFGTDWLREV